MAENKEDKLTTIIPNACPQCGGDVYDGTGNGWEVCSESGCDWMG